MSEEEKEGGGRAGMVIRVHENMLSEEERRHVDYLTVPHTEEGPGYMRPCMLQVVHEVRQRGRVDLNVLLDKALEHQQQHEAGGHVHPPREFICPISLDVMDPPVSLVSNGVLHTFDRDSITNWLVQSGTNPLTRERASPRDLVANTSLAQAISTWKKKRHISGLQFNVCDDH